ncbi:MAG: hypothetical protein A3C03_01425 [Candidatus Colwellbacteria bacterium RIFCSPHIGHO2_02_FULL_45_17]|uniref:BsaWI restriction endonuclease type 2 domain-containing protein n=1 Tax=Candidatus Colwellbacteria bacterium RIFCSPLOWO2_12_FULL_46_17 TaxID=1797695 RepID=A0A1G1ZE25_9BACT|nr:MAG: hypothetical protein A3C03_01425 [Candidatus Colwellbacteria bacterium RIFCSPHIGHO2_02_FULL_45_17]OGY62679.1 MAG: hypothetical protein A3G58_00740 [Candidatus Colwellbacteria bacterium RIFCSPLOWO2_12_FULL_46_17]
MPGDYETIDERQRYVQQSGRDWEDFVMEKVNSDLDATESSLKVIRGDDVPKDSTLWNKLAIPVGEPSSTQKIWGDVDLVVVDELEQPLAVISCKTSLHGRLSETLFYAKVLRDLVPGLKIVFATSDKGRQQKKTWSSEWGSADKPTKDRLLGSHYLDGVYILNDGTKLGGIIKSLDELAGDLVDWTLE